MDLTWHEESDSGPAQVWTRNNESGQSRVSVAGLFRLSFATMSHNNIVHFNFCRFSLPYGLDCLGFEHQWGRDFPYTSRLAPRLTPPPI